MPGVETLVVVPTLGNRPGWLRDTLGSIVGQHIEDVDIVVIAPSNSAARDICQGFDVRHHDFDQKGLSRAINEGFRQASRDTVFMTWLGDDDLLAPGSLSAAQAALAVAPEAVMVHGKTRYINADGSTRYVGRSSRWGPWYATFGWNTIAQPGSLLRRSAVQAAAGLNEEFAHAMDLDLWLRLRKQGPAVYISKELSAYRWHETSISASKPDRSEVMDIQRRNAQHPLLQGVLSSVARTGLDRLVHKASRSGTIPPIPTVHGKPYVTPGAWSLNS